MKLLMKTFVNITVPLDKQTSLKLVKSYVTQENHHKDSQIRSSVLP